VAKLILNSPQPCLPTGLGLDTFLKTTFTTFWDKEIAQPLDSDTRRRAISAWAWVRISWLACLDCCHLISLADFKGALSQEPLGGSAIRQQAV
jgi:hypothetical protein